MRGSCASPRTRLWASAWPGDEGWGRGSCAWTSWGCLAGFAGVVRHTVTVSRPRVGVNQSVPTRYPQAFPANSGQVVTDYLIEVYIPETKDGRPEYYFPSGRLLPRIPAPENQAIAKRWARRTTTCLSPGYALGAPPAPASASPHLACRVKTINMPTKPQGLWFRTVQVWGQSVFASRVFNSSYLVSCKTV